MATATPASPQGRQPTRIAVMTSGGDSAGMNAAVRAVIKMAIFRGCQAFVIREGWEGLVRGNRDATPNPSQPPTPSEGVTPSTKVAHAFAQHTQSSQEEDRGDFVPTYGEGELLREGISEGDELGLKGRFIIRVGWDDVRSWMGEGGTLIGTARSESFRKPEGRLRAAHNLIIEGIDALAVCGGDGSLTGADKLRAEWPDLVKQLLEQGSIDQAQADRYAHLKIVGLVGSIDNDLATTDLTIGASTALARICEAVDSISSTAASHSRAFVVEVMGRHCGWLALSAGLATGADYIFIPERPPLCNVPRTDSQAPEDWAEDMCDVLQRHRELGKRKTIVIVAEGALDRNLVPIKADDIKVVLTERLGLDTRVTTLGHTQRGGRPDANDRILATLQGVDAVEALLESQPDTPSYVIGIRENKITRIPLMHAVEQTQRVAKAIENKDFDTALKLRDPEFEEGLQAFRYISRVDEASRVQEKHRLRIGIIHIGAPAGGMNAATRTAVRWCLARGHVPLLVHNGFPGLLSDNLVIPNWLRVDGWTTRGGSELGTNRVLPDEDLGGVAAKCQEHRIGGLLIIGGFEAFVAVKIMEEKRAQYPAFRMPIVAIPATISNNVPLNEFSLGSDTSLNALVSACDAVKQSASASRNRVFVVETQGGQCGYIAVMGALAAGAVLVYTPEVGIGLERLAKDVAFLQRRFRLDVPGKSEGRLVIRGEKASDVYTNETLTRILKQEGGGLFDARSASLGHTLQGGTPSPLDRARATRLAVKCCEFIERHALERLGANASSPANKDSAAIITIRGSSVVFTGVEEMAKEADMKKRRGKTAWWHGFKDLVELMGGRTGLGAE